MNTKFYSNVKCHQCGSDRETESNGYVVCTDCGLTKERSYDDQIPKFSDERYNVTFQNSIGKNINFVGALGSQIGYSSGKLSGPRGQQLQLKTIIKYNRLIRQHHKRALLEENATHLRTMIAFTRIVNQLFISSDIKSRALHLYWQNLKKGVRITNHILLIALCLLQSVREAGGRAPIRFSEIIQAFADNNHRVTNKNIMRLANDLGITLGPIRRKPEDYINRIAFEVVSDDNIKERLDKREFPVEEYQATLIFISNRMLEKINNTERGGVQPYPFAVSIVYLADRVLNKALKRKSILTQGIMAKATNSAEFTIRDHVYRFLGRIYRSNEQELIKDALNHIKIDFFTKNYGLGN